MKARDSSNKTTHYESDLMVGVREANNNAPYIQGSTGAAAVTYGVVSDSTVANINVTAKGSGGKITLTASSGIVLASTSLSIGSTTPGSSRMTALPFKGIFKSTLTWEVAAVSSHASAEITIASSIAGVAIGDIVSYDWVPQTGASTSWLALAGHRFSTVAASALTVTVWNVTSSAASSNSGEMTISWIDLT